MSNNQQKKILMVCLGNICRSPLAEGILKSKLHDTDFFIDSAGTGNWHAGEKPDRRSIEVAIKNKIDLTNQRARQISKEDFSKFDVILVMDNQNFEDVISLAPDEASKNKVRKIVDFDKSKNSKIPDPYYGTTKDFEFVFHLLDQICDEICSEIVHNRFFQINQPHEKP